MWERLTAMGRYLLFGQAPKIEIGNTKLADLKVQRDAPMAKLS